MLTYLDRSREMCWDVSDGDILGDVLRLAEGTADGDVLGQI
jgi:hypothetical protein